MVKISKEKIIKYCNRTIETSLYAVAFFIPISTAFIESFISLAIVSWLIKKITTRTKLKNIFYPNFLNLPILFYLLFYLVSSIFSSNQGISFKHLIFKIFEYLLLFFIVVETVDKRIAKNILIAIVFSVCLVGIDGVSQYFTHHDFIRHRTQVIEGRINGPFGTPNDFSNYMVTVLPLVASLCFLRFRLGIRLTLIIISLGLFICLLLSATKSAWIALLLVILLAAILGNKRLFLVGLCLVIVVLGFIPLLPKATQFRVTHFFYLNEAIHRDILWKMGLDMFLERPILGQGLGTFMYNFQRFKPQDYPENWGISYAHNCFIQIASETGILGLLSFISIIVVLFFTSFKLLRRIKEKYLYYYILSGLLMGIFAYLVSSFFDTNLYSLPLSVLFWFVLGLTVGITKVIAIESS